MGKLVIDGNSVYEIDEECARRRKLPKECGIYEHLLYPGEKIDINQKRRNKKNEGLPH